ncbi:facilitated trehalose transporter Tret1-like [Bicyclus anynana]|uniref:Facilitated trehalose transporter Tret1-like n=1 Tax=Bicyclus anynana TaxID=110368 RepID=A0A6J1N6D5_BICAN|nr:facilitated trehalose transporter Tret1-like [Bicyclus anynana]
MGEKLGRRWCYIAGSLPLFINWIILNFARTFTAFMLSRFLAGISSGSLWMLNAIATPEYTLTESRGLFISIVLVVIPAFGIALGHILGVLFHWRTLALAGVIATTVNVFLPYFCVESPHWLASRGRFEECENSFRKLHGKDTTRYNHELQLLIKLEYSKQKAANEINSNNTLRKLMLAFKKRYFWQLMLMSTVVYIYYSAAGKVVFSNLATVILEDITGTSDVLLFTFVVDGFIFAGTCVSCVLIKKLPIRVLLFSSGLTAVGILITLSACLYFKVYFEWINVMLLALYFIVTHAGPYPVMNVMLSEIFPLELKLYCILISSTIGMISVFLCVLILPNIVSVMGYYGFFLLNSGIMLACLAYLYICMPETKGKTLQEIEVYFKTNTFEVEEVLSTNEQIKALI